MMRPLMLAAALIGLAFTAHAQAPAKAQLQFRLSTGGLLAGTFTAIDIPALSVGLQGNDVVVAPLSGKFDGRKVTLSAGSMKDFTYKKLQQMVGQQMSVKVSIVPVGAAPGKRCRIILDGARLEKLTPDTITFKPSETPEFQCN